MALMTLPINNLSYFYLSVESEDLEDGFDEEPLNDQQWILQRKKIGLSRRTKRQRFVSSTGNIEILLSHIHSIVCAYTYL
jgi:hypothetical protein